MTSRNMTIQHKPRQATSVDCIAMAWSLPAQTFNSNLSIERGYGATRVLEDTSV